MWERSKGNQNQPVVEVFCWIILSMVSLMSQEKGIWAEKATEASATNLGSPSGILLQRREKQLCERESWHDTHLEAIRPAVLSSEKILIHNSCFHWGLSSGSSNARLQLVSTNAMIWARNRDRRSSRYWWIEHLQHCGQQNTCTYNLLIVNTTDLPQCTSLSQSRESSSFVSQPTWGLMAYMEIFFFILS